MKLVKFYACIFLSLLGAMSNQASAQVMDFNSLATVTTNPTITVNQPYVEDGFSLYTRGGVSFTYSGGTIYATTSSNANWTGSPGVYSGIGSASYGSAFILERVDGGLFDLLSMDAASFFTGGAGNNFQVYGYPGDGGSVSKNFTLDATTGTLETLTFEDGFKGLNKIIFSSVYAQVDNINLSVPSVSAVPEPETYALMLAGLGLIGAIASRRKDKQA